MESRALTTGEISKFCGVHFRTVIRWIDRGKLKAYKLPGRGDNRILVTDFLDFLHENQIPVPEELQTRSRRVLVVDDDEAVANAIQRILKRAGYEVVTALDGLSAGLSLESFRPSIITLDLAMPNMSGFQVIELIRRLPSQAGLKILVISAASQHDLEKAMDCGADAILGKPFESHLLLDRIGRLQGWQAQLTVPA